MELGGMNLDPGLSDWSPSDPQTMSLVSVYSVWEAGIIHTLHYWVV